MDLHIHVIFVKEYIYLGKEDSVLQIPLNKSPFQILLPYFVTMFAFSQDNLIKSVMAPEMGKYQKKNELHFKTL